MKFHFLATLLFIGQIVAAVIANPEVTKHPTSVPWLCSPLDSCILDNGRNVSEAKYYESQNDCRLSCGKYGAIWPMPTGECILGNERIHFDPLAVQCAVFAHTMETQLFIRESNNIFVQNILKECLTACVRRPHDQEVLIVATVYSTDLSLDWSTEESYTLSIKTKGNITKVDIEASTVYGARHAFETLSNLITGSKDKNLIMVSAAHISDCPKFSHRGLLLDTSRNFMPVSVIRNTLDGMAASKLNVFHWHAVDSHSFPLEIKRVPEMHGYGAYSSSNIYSRTETADIIKYARLRGIRVLIEIDGPSHAGNGWQWGRMAGLGNMAVCINIDPWRFFCGQPPCGQLNPINSNMYLVMKEIYEDLAEINAPEESVHMGGDEVNLECWRNSLEIRKHLFEVGLDLSVESLYGLWSNFHKKNVESWNEVNRKLYPHIKVPKPVVVWSSALTHPQHIEHYLPKESFIIQNWDFAGDPINYILLDMGYRLIISPHNAWYLDHGFWGNTIYNDWITVYNNKIVVDHPKVLGGEVCMWSEYVDQNSVEGRIWPRAGAAAERLWSDPPTNYLQARKRFYRYRERLISRGIRADAIVPSWCVRHESQCL